MSVSVTAEGAAALAGWTAVLGSCFLWACKSIVANVVGKAFAARDAAMDARFQTWSDRLEKKLHDEYSRRETTDMHHELLKRDMAELEREAKRARAEIGIQIDGIHALVSRETTYTHDNVHQLRNLLTGLPNIVEELKASIKALACQSDDCAGCPLQKGQKS